MNFVYVQEYEQFSSKFHSNFPDILKIFSHFTTFSNIWNFYPTIETKKTNFSFSHSNSKDSAQPDLLHTERNEK